MDAPVPNIAEDGCTVILANGAHLSARADGDAMMLLAHVDGELGAVSLATIAEARAYATLILEQCRNEEIALGQETENPLTERETEILRYFAAGFSIKEVARRLTLSVNTVSNHRRNLRRKTQTGRLKDLVSLARRLGLDPVVA